MTNPIVRQATSEDATRPGTIGPAAYLAAYAHIWDDAAALARWLSTFSAEAFTRFIARTDTRIWVCEVEGEIVGFLTMVIGSSNPATKEDGGAEIPRIYILPGATGLGLGKRMVDAAIAEARDLSLTHVWLDHMKSAEYAGRTYQKWGFVPLGTWTFDQPVKPGFAEMAGLVYRL